MSLGVGSAPAEWCLVRLRVTPRCGHLPKHSRQIWQGSTKILCYFQIITECFLRHHSHDFLRKYARIIGKNSRIMKRALKVSFTNWSLLRNGESDQSLSSCAYMVQGSSRWNSGSCFRELPYICQAKLKK